MKVAQKPTLPMETFRLTCSKISGARAKAYMKMFYHAHTFKYRNNINYLLPKKESQAFEIITFQSICAIQCYTIYDNHPLIEALPGLSRIGIHHCTCIYHASYQQGSRVYHLAGTMVVQAVMPRLARQQSKPSN